MKQCELVYRITSLSKGSHHCRTLPGLVPEMICRWRHAIIRINVCIQFEVVSFPFWLDHSLAVGRVLLFLKPKTEVLGPLCIVLFWASPYHKLFKVHWESALNNSFKLASLGVTALIFFRIQGMLWSIFLSLKQLSPKCESCIKVRKRGSCKGPSRLRGDELLERECEGPFVPSQSFCFA